MHSNKYTILFTATLTIVLGSFVSVASGSLKSMQDLNIENDSKKNILVSLGYKESDDEKWTSDDIQDIFKKNIKSLAIDAKGNVIDDYKQNENLSSDLNLIYIDQKNGIPNGYAIPISGKGLWSTLYGYFAVEPDGITAKGITFYAHKETPGLGGEVDKPWFQNNFIGKKFIDENGELVGIEIVKGKADPKNPYQVDGISGATVTSKGLENFLLNDLKKYEPFFSKIRGV